MEESMMKVSIAILAPVVLIVAATLSSGSAVAQYGPDTCRQGYVWRDAVPGDHVCVPPWIRAQAQQENFETRYRYRYQ
jgi:hypothetical protein